MEKEDELETRASVRELEQFYTDGSVDDMLSIIEEKKLKIVKDMCDYATTNRQTTRWDRYGNPIQKEVKMNPLVVSEYFFKPIVKIGSIEPTYNAEKLSMVFDYYMFLITEVNMRIGNYPTSLTGFCKLAGITTTYLRKLKESPDLNMRIIVQKIYDQIGDNNITMSQLGIVNEKTTLFKMKAQNEITEKEQPKVNINITADTPDMDRIKERMSKYSNLIEKKDKKGDD